ncbi:MAG: hypothetical protein M3Q22_15705, partial [Actinomycetota bacterium]|nr:hypothetical protein [Actinomycetota bacterium]
MSLLPSALRGAALPSHTSRIRAGSNQRRRDMGAFHSASGAQSDGFRNFAPAHFLRRPGAP